MFSETHCTCRCVVSSSVSVDLGICPELLLAELARVEGDIEALTTIKYLNLKTMGDIKYQLQVCFITIGDIKYQCQVSLLS